MKTNVQLWFYLAHFIVEWEMFQIKDVEKNTYVPKPFSSKIVSFMR